MGGGVRFIGFGRIFFILISYSSNAFIWGGLMSPLVVEILFAFSRSPRKFFYRLRHEKFILIKKFGVGAEFLAGEAVFIKSKSCCRNFWSVILKGNPRHQLIHER